MAQKKALRIINFKQLMEPSEPLYQKLKINKLKNNIILSNCLFFFDKLTNNLPDVFDKFFQPLKEQHNHNTIYVSDSHLCQHQTCFISSCILF